MENPHKKKNWNEKYLSSMKYTSFERRNYYISTLDGEETYIIGYNLDKKEGFAPNKNEIVRRSIIKNENIKDSIKAVYERDFISYKTDIMYKGWSVLDSLISLRQKLKYSYSIDEDSITNKELIQLERNLSKEEKKEILKWLKIYGMPFLGDRIENKEMRIGISPFGYGFKNDIQICDNKNACICRLGSFLIALNIVFNTFYYYLLYLDKNIELEELEFDMNNINKEDLMSYIKRAFSSISDKAIINLDNIIEGKELPRFEGCTETIISLAIYQLAIITSSKKILDTKICSLCKNIFIPTRKSRCYCKTCSRQKAYKDKPK